MVMVRKIHKINTLYALLAVAFAPLLLALPVAAESTIEDGVGVDLEVNITEVLSVSVATPSTWASGDVDINNGSDLLRNKIVLNVTSNNVAGFTASMASKTTTDLVNLTKSTATIPTLASATTAAAFPVNYWGYSIDDTDAGSDSANYAALQTSAITLASPTAPATYSQDIFFGARADATKDSGTYANTVVISVVSGVITTPSDPVNPSEPSTPATPSEPTTNQNQVPNNNLAYLDGSESESDSDDLTENNITAGDVSSSYAEPQGVTTTNIGAGSPLATGLAVTAGVAATSGVFFFVLARRKKEEEEEEEEI